MPDFTGQRKTRYYQARAVHRHLSRRFRTGKYDSDKWTDERMQRVVKMITGINTKTGDILVQLNTILDFIVKENKAGNVYDLEGIAPWE